MNILTKRKETLPVFLRPNCNLLSYGHQLYAMSWVSHWFLAFGRWLAKLLSGVFSDPGQPVVDPEEAHPTVILHSCGGEVVWCCGGVVWCGGVKV